MARDMRMILAWVALAAALSAPAASASAQCPEGRVATAETSGRCCWPGQTFSTSATVCEGAPACPSPLVAQGDDCVPPQGATTPAEGSTTAAASSAQPRATSAAQPGPLVRPTPTPWVSSGASDGSSGLLWPAAPDLEGAVLAPRFVRGTDDGLVLAGLLTFAAGYLGGIVGGVIDQSARNCRTFSSGFGSLSTGCDSWPLALVPIVGGILAGTAHLTGSRDNVAIGVLVGGLSAIAQVGGLAIVMYALVNPTEDVVPTIDLDEVRLTFMPYASASDAGLVLSVEL